MWILSTYHNCSPCLCPQGLQHSPLHQEIRQKQKRWDFCDCCNHYWPLKWKQTQLDTVRICFYTVLQRMGQTKPLYWPRVHEKHRKPNEVEKARLPVRSWKPNNANSQQSAEVPLCHPPGCGCACSMGGENKVCEQGEITGPTLFAPLQTRYQGKENERVSWSTPRADKLKAPKLLMAQKSQKGTSAKTWHDWFEWLMTNSPMK